MLRVLAMSQSRDRKPLRERSLMRATTPMIHVRLITKTCPKLGSASQAVSYYEASLNRHSGLWQALPGLDRKSSQQ
ncbi:hypothetical protein CBOM_07590 [Ceraceosorus bombacis]|uniref:Uncharacterized protein n=1 Tax=Ceraceosorus bombacis TaxID=401625 RepID=A0A0P1BG23_9BASI|nr:hypothetical protein CBOM_07590 [Ceraceosorus bombacis]